MIIAVLVVVVVLALGGVALLDTFRRRRRSIADLLAEAQTEWWPQFERDFRAYARHQSRSPGRRRVWITRSRRAVTRGLRTSARIAALVRGRGRRQPA